MKKLIVAVSTVTIICAAFAINCGAMEKEGAENKGVAVSEEQKIVESLSILKYPDKTIYGAFEEFQTAGLKLICEFDDGTKSEVDPKELSVSYQQDKCFRVGDSHVFLSYGTARLSLPVTVNRIRYDIEPVELQDFSVEYSGTHQSCPERFSDIVGLDGIPLGVTATGGGIDVGKYEVSINFHTESKDYTPPESVVCVMTIEPKVTEVIWSDLSFVYDGKSKLPKAYYYNVYGEKIYLSVIGSEINAGVGYQAEVAVTNKNYSFIGTVASYDINKANYDFSNIKWSRNEFVYDGGRKSVSLSGLPEGVRVTNYTGDCASDAGKYLAVATLAYDDRNYNPPSQISYTWEILPAEYDVSGISFQNAEYVYDGKMHYPKLVGKMPVGEDGIPLSYSFSHGACHVSEGWVSVSVIFQSESKNYNLPKEIFSSVRILPLEIEVNWGGVNLSYTGESVYPTVYSEHCLVKVEGGAVDVGEYTATAFTENSDFIIKNCKKDFKILKSRNMWTKEPLGNQCFEGKEIKFDASSRFGSIEYVFYSDPLGEKVISAPKNKGSYYAKAVVFDTKNFTGLESEIFSFDVVEIRPVSFYSVMEKGEKKAFETILDGDVNSFIVNNDGSEALVDFSLISVIYQNGTSLRKKDGYVTIKYENFSYRLALDVGYADYALDSVKWTDTVATYDGSPKNPTLCGLPEGVNVISYVGGDAVSAGDYTVMAKLGYDAENYNEPKISGCNFRINKKILGIPHVKTEYNGEVQFPSAAGGLYSITVDEGYTNVGKYSVRAELLDSTNYSFTEKGDSICDAIFEILPKNIKAFGKDVTLHLFQSPSTLDYRIPEGQTVNGEKLVVTVYNDGVRFYLKSEDPNYKIELSGGEIIRLPYPSLSVSVIMIGSFLLSVLLLVYFYSAKIRKYDLVNLFAVIKCRWHNRRLSVYPPRPFRENTRPRPSKIVDKKENKACEKTEEYGDFSNSVKESCKGGKKEGISDAASIHQNVLEDEKNDADGEGGAFDFAKDKENALFGFGIDVKRADSLISDSLAKNLVKKSDNPIYTSGNEKAVISIDLINDNFASGERVDINALKSKKLITEDASYLKIVEGGVIEKPFTVYANEFNLTAVKMIALTGGEAIKAQTVRIKNEGEES